MKHSHSVHVRERPLHTSIDGEGWGRGRDQTAPTAVQCVKGVWGDVGLPNQVMQWVISLRCITEKVGATHSAHTDMHMHTHAHTHARTCTHTHAHMHMHTRACTHTHTHTHARTHAHTHTGCHSPKALCSTHWKRTWTGHNNAHAGEASPTTSITQPQLIVSPWHHPMRHSAIPFELVCSPLQPHKVVEVGSGCWCRYLHFHFLVTICVFCKLPLWHDKVGGCSAYVCVH